MTLQAGEYGKVLILDAGMDLTGQTGIELEFQYPDGSSKTISSGLVVGTTDLVVDGETYLANTYVTYTLVNGDIYMPGLHRRKLSVRFGGSKRLVSMTDDFDVFD